MEKAELEKIGVKVGKFLIERDYASIAQWLGYALSFSKTVECAIKDDFEESISQSGGILEKSKYQVEVKNFTVGTPGFTNLIEGRFIFTNSKKEVLVEIIHNELGTYLEQISCVG